MRIPWRKETQIERSTAAIIGTNEDPDVVRAVQSFLQGPSSEANAALPSKSNHIQDYKVKGEGHADSWTRYRRYPWHKHKERNRRRVRPAALRQLPLVMVEDRPALSPRVTQITPKQKHASSGFPYPPWLEEHGVTQED